MLEVERRDQQVDPLRRVVANGEPQRRDLLGQGPQLRVAGRPRPRTRIEHRRRHGVEAQAALRPVACRGRQQAPPDEREREHPLGAERLRPRPREVAQPAHGEGDGRGAEPSARRNRSSVRRRARGIRVPAAHVEHRRELHQPADVDEVVHPPHPDPLAGAAPRAEPLAQPRRRRGVGVPERRVAVLDVVVERPVDVADVAERPRGQREPVIVEVGELRRGEGERVVEQRAREQRGGAGHGVGGQQRQQARVVVGPVLPVRVGHDRAVAPDHALVAVDERRAVEVGQQRRRACRDATRRPGRRARRSGRRRRQRERTLEIRVEAAPPVRRREHEARVVAEHRSDLLQPLGPRAVVGHHAQPVRLGLRADRLDLAPEQPDRRLVRGHADGHQGSARERLGQRGDRDPRQLLLEHPAALEPGAQPQVDR